ncbi:MAG: CDF family Co(II)/Ni(II) efflux transporter DmeF [SAR324 cluster bacterium]|nr:CDF family Co(II)/Ni(II) efflux transporter DmeF [SAR324 cluster bacterium]
MHRHSLDQWKHDHQFNIVNEQGERNTLLVILLTLVMMVIEVGGGIYYGSMALLADGWHMGSHASALGITIFAYRYARHHANDARYSFGTGKVGSLGGFASAIALAVVALLMAVESIKRLISPESIQFNEAIGVAVVGLVVNLLSAFLLKDHHHHHGHDDHHHDHSHDQDHHHHRHEPHHDHNLRGAYLHVLADAMTSVMAIVALFAGKLLGWIWMDAMMGIVGAFVILHWSRGLLRETSRILLDGEVNPKTVEAIRTTIESDSDNRIADFHIWSVGSPHLSLIVSIVTHYPKPPGHYKSLLRDFKELVHVTIEVNRADSEPCLDS